MGDSFDFDLICVGSGPAGQRAAVQAAKLGRRVALIERARVLGGNCLDTGTIPSKTFREAVLALTRRDPRDGNGRGGDSRPTAIQLLSKVREVVARECEVIENQLRRNDVTLFWGSAAFRDPHTLAIDTGRGVDVISGANVLIAVGTQPAAPPGVAPDGETVITSDGVIGLQRLPKTMAVVGGGVIGMEYASMFATLGIPVTLVEQRHRALEFLDGEIVDELIHQMRKRNVTFRFGEAVEQMEIASGPTRQVALKLASGKRIVADLALFSAGRMGATDRLQLDAAGLKADQRGRLVVDAGFHTAVHHILAAGDVIGYPSLAATSSEQGRLAACSAFGVTAGPMADHFPIGIYAIPEISMVGETEEQLTEQKVPYEVGIARYREIARGQILGDDSGLLKLLFHREERRLLGVHAIGTGATELIHIGQAVIGLGGGLDYFLRTVFNYPTLAECYKVAALDAANKLAR